jgi:histidinol-phosphatase
MKAGRSTLAHYQTGIQAEQKQDLTPVTIADKTAERIIREGLCDAFPGEAILGEEEGLTGEGNTRWVIDPIDGTKSFVCGVPLYATLLSFERDGEPEIGVSFLPALNELLYAERGQGAFWNGRPCRVSGRKSLEGAALSCGGHISMEKYGRMAGLLRAGAKSMATRTWSDAYGHALVATGRIDAMIDPIVNHWDISAMSLIVKEAGGRFTSIEGADGLHTNALSSNGHIHELLVEAFKR